MDDCVSLQTLVPVEVPVADVPAILKVFCVRFLRSWKDQHFPRVHALLTAV